MAGDSIAADAARAFVSTFRGLKPTAKVIRPLRGQVARHDRKIVKLCESIVSHCESVVWPYENVAWLCENIVWACESVVWLCENVFFVDRKPFWAYNGDIRLDN